MTTVRTRRHNVILKSCNHFIENYFRLLFLVVGGWDASGIADVDDEVVGAAGVVSEATTSEVDADDEVGVAKRTSFPSSLTKCPDAMS